MFGAHLFSGERKHIIEQGAIRRRARQGIRHLRRLALREGGHITATESALHIGAATLHKVARQPVAFRIPHMVEVERSEFRVEQPDQARKGVLYTGVRRRRQQDQIAGRIARQGRAPAHTVAVARRPPCRWRRAPHRR